MSSVTLTLLQMLQTRGDKRCDVTPHADRHSHKSIWCKYGIFAHNEQWDMDSTINDNYQLTMTTIGHWPTLDLSDGSTNTKLA